ncbi:hypothetical protein AB0L13_02780 [Saccharopolyspora shandongensis]|uniref:hypothetical protein n=1 Tax=Saccharopolyspora shandongensis TaxID=418495 RepID=UPI00343B5E7D
MARPLARWRAGFSDWHPLPQYEIFLERTAVAWRVSYFVHGELHARIGFDTEDEAHHNIEWLKTECPPHQSWHQFDPPHDGPADL